jgi:tetratricopeptide (TPR) repeat protein
MIVKNEARVLRQCLESARPWVDEIIVVDTGSTDETATIAREFEARVIAWPWRDDFAAARNESLRHATGDWILVLDADEALVEGAGLRLRAACEGPADIVAYCIKIVCPREGDGGLTRLNWFPRLFRNLPGVRFEGVIHEQVVGSLDGHGRIERADVEVLHEGYTRAAEEMTAKAERNRKLLLRQLRADATYAPGWFQLAETYVLLGRPDEAIDAYRRCLRLLESSRLTLPPGVVAVALQNLGATLIGRGQREQGIRMIETALVVAPDMAPAHVHLGHAALIEGRGADAERHFEQALAIVSAPDDGLQYEASPWLIHFLRGCARARQEKFIDGIASFEAGLALHPTHADGLWLLALTAAQARQWAKSLEALDRLRDLGRDDFAYHAQRAQALAALGRHAEAIETAAAALAREPESVPVLALAAESTARAGRPREAADLYERLAARVPDPTPALLALAQCCEEAGERDRMTDAYRRAVEAAPESPDVLFALGSACLRGGALDAAEDCLAQAIERRPERADYRVNHALCVIKRGELARADAALDAMVARWPELTRTHDLRALLVRLREALPAGTP